MDPQRLRQVFGLFTTGVAVVTARDAQGDPVGVTANSVASVSLEPPLILWCLANQSRKSGIFCDGAPFAIHFLREDQADVAMAFARSGGDNRVLDAFLEPGAGPPRVRDVLARIECKVAARHLAGDHTIIVGEVEELEASIAPPLAFHKSAFGRFSVAVPAGGEECQLLMRMWS